MASSLAKHWPPVGVFVTVRWQLVPEGAGFPDRISKLSKLYLAVVLSNCGIIVWHRFAIGLESALHAQLRRLAARGANESDVLLGPNLLVIKPLPKCKPDTDREVLGQYLERFGAIHLRKVDKAISPNRF